MPTKKKRIGFIPRTDVMDLIDKLSYESNLSYSKIINILVEEALHRRGMFNIKNSKRVDSSFFEANENNLKKINREFAYNFKNNMLKNETINFREENNDESLDTEIYSKFLIFLQFQERMRKRNNL